MYLLCLCNTILTSVKYRRIVILALLMVNNR